MLTLELHKPNQFDRVSWVGMRVLVLNDVSSIGKEDVKLLKQLSGKDRIKYDIKHKQTNADFVYGHHLSGPSVGLDPWCNYQYLLLKEVSDPQC